MDDEKTPEPDKWLPEKEAIEEFRISHSTLHRKRKKKEIDVSKIGRKVYYSVASIRAMFERNRK
jgi:hypothetical protein